MHLHAYRRVAVLPQGLGARVPLAHELIQKLFSDFADPRVNTRSPPEQKRIVLSSILVTQI